MTVQKLTLHFESVEVEVKLLTAVITLGIRNVLLYAVYLKPIRNNIEYQLCLKNKNKQIKR